MPKYFGTDGARGAANVKITPELAFRIGRFIGYYPEGKKNRILIARDTRISGQMLSCSLISGIVASGSDVYDLGVSTTPSVSYLVRKHNFDYGVMISASHNPYYDNGIKIFNRHGEKLEANIEALIEEYIDCSSHAQDMMIPYAKNEHIGVVPKSKQLIDEYITFLSERASPLVTGLNVLFDCANGSSSRIIPELVKRLGINATIINASPNGVNINAGCGSTHLSSLIAEMNKGDYDCAFAFDGDADRCLAIDKFGKVVDGDAIIYLAAMNMKKNGFLKDDAVVYTVMSNLGLRIAFKNVGIKGVEVGVGDKYVQAELKKNNYSLGGEQSGHIIFLDDMNTGDGLLTMIKVLNVMVDERKSLDELTKDLVIYPQLLKNIVVENKEAVLSDPGLNKLIKTKQDELGEYGRILVRASGTESLIRVMCEAKSDEICKSICDSIINYINELQQ